MGIWEVILLNKKWEQDLTATLIYIPGLRLMKWPSKWSSKRTEFWVSFLLIWFTKRFNCFLRSGFLMGKWKVTIITLLASFKFSSGIFITQCSANMLQTKNSTRKKDNNQNSMAEKYFFSYKKKSCSRLVPVWSSTITNIFTFPWLLT